MAFIMRSVEWNASPSLPRPIDGSDVKFKRYSTNVSRLRKVWFMQLKFF